MSTDFWNSPKWILDMFSTYHDPCPENHKIDAFSYDWCEYHDQVFVNPPYSNPKRWVKYAINQHKIYPNSTIVLLMRHDSSTEWYRMLHEYGAHFLLCGSRLKFRPQTKIQDYAKPANFASVLIVLSKSEKLPKNQKTLGDNYES